MANQVFQGFYEALAAGLLEGTPDIRLMLTMPGFDCDDDSVHPADATDLDEFDGVNYVEIDAAGVVSGYVEASDHWAIDCDDDSFGTDVVAGSGIMEGIVVKLYVDGTDANDYILGRVTEGLPGVNAAGGDVDLVVPDAGLMRVKLAA
jgi:hypothetical protein